jgi:16S rRNA processing protein RimM
MSRKKAELKGPSDGQSWLVIGDVGRPHGLRGEVVVRPTTDFPERFAAGERLRVLQDGRIMRLEVASVRPLSKGLAIKFHEVSDRNAADGLRGAEVVIALDEARPLPEGAYYPHELVGLDVVEESGAALGCLVDVLELPGGGVLVVASEGGEQYLPAAGDVVRDVDLARGLMTVCLTEETV